MYTAASGMIANQAAQDAIAQNLANVSTTGYKQDVPRFAAFQNMLLKSGGELGLGAGVDSLSTNFAEGSLQKTSNPLDIALTGDAFLTVKTPQGIAYSRDGALTRDAKGFLIQANGGAQVMDSKNQPIQIPAGTKSITISDAGEVSADGQSVSRIGLVGINKSDKAVKIGSNLFTVAKPRAITSATPVQQGFLETSNVNIVKEMVSMISAMRAYETDQKMVQAEDGATQKAVNEVAKVP
jgi:flagellar basal-body rod protein FlgF